MGMPSSHVPSQLLAPWHGPRSRAARAPRVRVRVTSASLSDAEWLDSCCWRQQQLANAGVQPSVVLVHAPCLDSAGLQQASTCLGFCAGGCAGLASASLCRGARRPRRLRRCVRSLGLPAATYHPVPIQLAQTFRVADPNPIPGQRSLLWRQLWCPRHPCHWETPLELGK